jgi:membrane peptidoglycan carboxypeptidase
VALAIFALLFCGLLIIGGFYYASLTDDLPSIAQLSTLLDKNNGELLQPTRLLDRSGTQVLYSIENDGVTRHFLSVNPDEVDHFSLQLLRLTVAELDPTFWSNNGATPLTDLDSQPRTIAERLVKSLLLANETESTRSTIRMKVLAAQVVHNYGRTQTLEWFLNSVALGHLSFGVDSAAQLYLHKSAADLDLAESALLVSLMESPALNPVDASTAALENQQKLLKSLADTGVISADEYSSAAAEKLTLYGVTAKNHDSNAEFIQLVTDQLESELGQDRVERGGLVVTTTLDTDLQAQFTCTARSQMIQIESSVYSGIAPDTTACPAANLLPTQNFTWNGSSELGAAGLIMDPQKGQILAYVSPTTLSGAGFSTDYQPGSLTSPFVALAAFARGTSPASLEWDVPSTLPADLADQQNPDGTFHGPVNVRSALANDYAVPFASLLEQMDPQTVWALADAVGFSSPKNDSAPASLLFGGGKSSLVEIAQAYATLAVDGSQKGVLNTVTGRIEPIIVLKVQSPSGQVLVDNSTPQTQAVLSPSLTYLINNILSDETARWTSLGHPNVLEIGRTAAVKIGQVAQKNQTWTVGYTPDRLVLTWMGEQDQDTSSSPLQPGMAAGLWHALIQYTTQDLPETSWIQPADVSTVQVCAPSGMLPTAICPNITNDVFLNGNEPTQADTLYIKLSVNRETGLLATVFTPAESIEDKVFLNVPANLRDWASSAGLPIPPLGYDAISTAQADPQVNITAPGLFSAVAGKVVISGTAEASSFASFSVQVGKGINPQDWQQVGSTGTTPVDNGTLAVWDTTGLDGLYAIRLNVVDTNNQIQTAVIQVTVDNVPPSIHITYPTDGSQISSVNHIVTLNTDVTDEVSVADVQWWVDGRQVGERTEPPFTYLWSSTPGKHILQIKASDNAGNQSESTIVNFTVLP